MGRKERKVGLERGRDRVEGEVQRTIESLGRDSAGRYRRLEGNLFRFSLPACPPSVVITDEDRVPIEYKCYTLKLPAELWEEIAAMLDAKLLAQVQQHVALREVSVDKRAIKAEIEAGWQVPGADLNTCKYRLERK